jgi:putative ABC transport system ATP-binding protein
MQIQFRQVVPIPLNEKLSGKASDLWNRDIAFEQGTYVKITAPSGTGKTTLMHSLYHLRDDYTGQILFDNIPIRALSPEALALLRQQQISIVFQDLRLFDQLTARENIELKRIFQHPYYPASMIDTMAAALGITHILDQKAGICSYGEQQRIAIIRALIQPFSWLIMDEPFSHLDQQNIRKAIRLIQQECTLRNAGLLITDLETDQHFPYSTILSL